MKENTKKEAIFKPSANLPIKKLAYISKKDFLQHFDIGINETVSKQGIYPLDETKNILMMYHSRSRDTSKVNIQTVSSSIKATQECDVMLVIGNRPRSDKHCLAYFNNYDSFHIQRYHRNTKEDGSKEPLQHIGRGIQITNMMDEFRAPPQRFIENHFNLLQQYLNSVDGILKTLKPITRNIAKDNTIVIMVCNEGQVSLLLNFVCSAKAKGFDISMVLVFATDRVTYNVAKGLGIEAFFDESVCYFYTLVQIAFFHVIFVRYLVIFLQITL